MKQKKLVSMIGALVIMIIAVALITGCPQQPNNKKDDTTKTGNTGNTGGNNSGNTGGNTGGNNGSNVGGNTGSSFAPFTGENDESLWKSRRGNGTMYIYIQKGVVYELEYNGTEVTSALSVGSVKNGKIVFKRSGVTTEIVVSIEGDEFKLGTGAHAEIHDRERDAIILAKVKKALSGV